MSAEIDYWLSSRCWRCGVEAQAGGDGRVLCPPCRMELFGPVRFSVNIVRPVDWILTHCWRCQQVGVEAKDPLGLCARCIDALKEAA